MKTVVILVVVVALAGCSPKSTPAEQELMKLWSAKGSSAVERRDAINRCFPLGTPIQRVIRVLGPNYMCIVPYSAISLDGSKKTRSLEYRLSDTESICIGTTAALDENELAAKFTGAGMGQTVPLSLLTNRSRDRQPDGAANRSQPIRSETNRTSAAAGSDR